MLTINTKLTLPIIIIIILVCKATKGNILDIFCLLLTLLHMHVVYMSCASCELSGSTHSCGTCKCTRAPRTCSPWSRMWNLKQYDVFHSFFSSLDLPLSSICMYVHVFFFTLSCLHLSFEHSVFSDCSSSHCVYWAINYYSLAPLNISEYCRWSIVICGILYHFVCLFIPDNQKPRLSATHGIIVSYWFDFIVWLVCH